MSTRHLNDDDHELAEFGYKQELVRTLGQFSTFATGFAFISILTGMFLLFGFVYGSGGPASIWAWLIAFGGQLLFALAFAELSVRYPLQGSVYNWTKLIARNPATSWMAGVSMILALTVSTAAVALAMQAILPAISDVFWIYGDGTGENDGTVNGVILGSIMLVATTAVMLMGTRVRGLVNNIGVSIELVGVVVLIVALALNAERGLSVVFETNGTGANFDGGYLGALLLCLLLGVFVMWGFDTAGSIGEETVNPRRACPRGIVRALLASGILGGLLLLTAFMSVPNLAAEELSGEGLAYVIKTVLGETFGDVMLVCAAVAVFVCALANQTGAVNMMFAMSRDNALPGSARLAHVTGRARTPVIPPILVAVVAIAILVFNVGQSAIFLVVSSTTVIFALFSYLLIAVSFSLRRSRGEWERPAAGFFGLGRLGLPVSVAAAVWAAAVIVNISWPREALYNPESPFHWYLRWGGVLVPVVALGAAFAVYWFTRRGKLGVLPEHAAGAPAQSAASASDGVLVKH